MRSKAEILAVLTEALGEYTALADSPEDVQDLFAHRHRVDASLATLTERLRQSEAFKTDDPLSDSMQAWLSRQCNLAPAAAKELVSAGALMEALPETREEFTSGRVSLTHVGMVASLVETTSLDTVRESEATLLETARNSQPQELRKECNQQRRAFDESALLREENRAHERRYLKVSKGPGSIYLEGRLDMEAGQTFLTALDAAAAPPTADDTRSHQQRLADALTDLCSRLLASGELGRRGRQRPHLIVTVPYAELEDRLGAEAAELGGNLLSREALDRLACDCEVSRVVFGPDSEILDAGRTHRYASPAQDRALRVRDRHCRAKGCDRPAAWCDVHHILHWIRHLGPSDLDNLVLLCRRHHRLVHEGRIPTEQILGPPPPIIGSRTIPPPGRHAKPVRQEALLTV